MPSALTYFCSRLKPFFLFFMGVELLIRLVLLGTAWADVAGALPRAPLAILLGFIFDATVFFYFAVPVALYLLALPASRHGTAADRAVTAVFFFIIAFIMLFSATGEWFFWDEFQARYNFIAVDYLVYTQEVIGNIRESYPVFPLMAAMAVIAAYFSIRVFKQPVLSPPPALRQRGAAFAGLAALCVVAFFGVRSSYADHIGDNRYMNEVARNGIYELFSAFRNNTLSYNKFYARLPESKVVDTLRTEIGLEGVPNPASPLQRFVKNKPAPSKYNLVLITVESLSADYLGVFGNANKLTPNLDALSEHSMFFRNLYATGTRTVYGLSAITLGMPPVPGNSIVRQPDNGNMNSLGHVLQGQGYSTKFIYGGFGYFDNMNAFFAANNYDIVDRNSLAKDEITFANVWGVADEDLYARVLKENDKEAASGKPFFDMIMTTSNHRPYTYPDGRIDIPSHSGRWGGVKYTDWSISKFLNDAKKHSWFKNTIFVIIADHTAGSSGKAELQPDKYHIPLFIYAPGIIKPQKVDKMASQIDLAPTLLGLMGVSYDSRFYGKDLMKESPERALISNYQKLGYLTHDGLIILKPVGVSEYFSRHNDELVKEAKPPQTMLDKAIAYYQGASKWKTWSRQP